jgi:hypothetical protein
LLAVAVAVVAATLVVVVVVELCTQHRMKFLELSEFKLVPVARVEQVRFVEQVDRIPDFFEVVKLQPVTQD